MTGPTERTLARIRAAAQDPEHLLFGVKASSFQDELFIESFPNCKDSEGFKLIQNWITEALQQAYSQEIMTNQRQLAKVQNFFSGAARKDAPRLHIESDDVKSAAEVVAERIRSIANNPATPFYGARVKIVRGELVTQLPREHAAEAQARIKAWLYEAHSALFQARHGVPCAWE